MNKDEYATIRESGQTDFDEIEEITSLRLSEKNLQTPKRKTQVFVESLDRNSKLFRKSQNAITEQEILKYTSQLSNSKSTKNLKKEVEQNVCQQLKSRLRKQLQNDTSMNSSEFTQIDFTKGLEQEMSSENKSESNDSQTCDYDT